LHGRQSPACLCKGKNDVPAARLKNALERGGSKGAGAKPILLRVASFQWCFFTLPRPGKTLSFRAMSSEVFHSEVWYEGHVQGVGFRAHALHVARGYEVTGTVRNHVDGRVFLHVEGTQKEVAAFLDEMRVQLSAYIRKVEVHEFWGTRCFTNFRISV
jgi:acylphosphatase